MARASIADVRREGNFAADDPPDDKITDKIGDAHHIVSERANPGRSEDLLERVEVLVATALLIPDVQGADEQGYETIQHGQARVKLSGGVESVVDASKWKDATLMMPELETGRWYSVTRSG